MYNKEKEIISLKVFFGRDGNFVEYTSLKRWFLIFWKISNVMIFSAHEIIYTKLVCNFDAPILDIFYQLRGGRTKISWQNWIVKFKINYNKLIPIMVIIENFICQPRYDTHLWFDLYSVMTHSEAYRDTFWS